MGADSSLLAFKERMAADREFRANYVMEHLEDCRRISSWAMHRAFLLGGQILGFGYDQGKYYLRRAIVFGPSALVPVMKPLVERDVGYVYHAQDVDQPRLVKIGFTRDPDRRLKQLANECRTNMRLLSLTPGMMLAEHAEHCRRITSRAFGEWFRIEAA